MSVFCSFENLSMEMYYVQTFHMLQEIVFYQAHYFWEELKPFISFICLNVLA